jgi:hypothetical protein
MVQMIFGKATERMRETMADRQVYASVGHRLREIAKCRRSDMKIRKG